jgi:hypothetical protein
MTTIYASAKALQNLPNRKDFDFYPTPQGVCDDALSFLPTDCNPFSILDPGAGTGVWGKAARKRYPSALITGMDIRPETVRPSSYNFWMHGDFLLTDSAPCFDLVIGNPPYKYAEQFVRHSLNMLESGGFLIMLLRLNFLEGRDRGGKLYRKYPPKNVVVRAGRVSFTGDGQANATAYAYFIWQKGWVGKPLLEWSLAA